MAIESVVVESLISKIVELLAGPVKKQFRYMFCFNNFVQEFNEQVRSLVLALYDLQVVVDDATKNAEKIHIYVNTWLEDAKKALALHGLQDAVNVATKNAEEIEIDVNKWLEDAKNKMEGVNSLENEKGKNGKCFTWCPKWIRQFKLSKALEKKTETLRKLEEESKKFQKVAHKVPLQDIQFLPSKEFTPSESSKEAFEQIMKALKDDNVNMIGLYGMGGVGKTTLVKEVGRRAKETQLFNEVLLATVSQNPNVTDIQDRIADRLRLQFDVKTKEGRADLLWQRLKKEKKLLVILDDVWKVVNVKEIGIPFGEAHRGCKVILTTRLRDICSYMECQQKVFLSILSENEAWALFKINANLCDEDYNLNTVANKVARECQGLPIALVTVGRALRDKSTIEWEVACKQLKNSQFQHMEQIGEEKNAYACLKLSYDYLKHEKTKLCFLLCCLFPEDHYIRIEDLTRYVVGYGLHQDVESIEDARKQVYVTIKTLIDCCMLLGTETEKEVKMHDLVRDVAIQIASSKEHGFMVKAGVGLKEWPMSTKSFEVCTTISLMGNKLKAKLPEGLAFPQLKVLLLELDDDLNVPESFFEGMKEIEVLSVKGGCLSLQSLELSTNLQSLLLIKCKCNDLIWLRNLQRLKILGFIGWSSLEELPDEIGELKELRLLDVTGCYSLRRIPVNLIGRLKKLEELLIGGYSFEGWGVVGGDSTRGMNACLTELNLLSYLAVLSLKIPRVECIPRDFVFPRLLRYDLVLGNGYSRPEHPTSTRLYLHHISAASLNTKTFEQLLPTVSQIGFTTVKGLENIAFSGAQMTNHGSQKDFLQRLEDVQVYRCRDIRTLFPAKWRQALNNLTSVEIQDCKSLEEVFELGEADEGSREVKELRLLSSLTRLVLGRLPELKCIWKGPTRHVSLRSLIHLELWSLHKLTFIFTQSLAQTLGHLETLWIDRCSGLKHLIRENDEESEIIPDSLGFRKLKTLFIRGCDKLEYVFPISVSPSLLNLEEMKISYGCNLKQILYSGEGHAHTSNGVVNFPRLRELSLPSGCSFFGPENFTAQLPSLQVLYINGHEEIGDLLAQLQGIINLRVICITDCKGAQELMQVGSFGTNGRTGHELSLLSLEKLDLSSLPDMRCIWKSLVASHLTTLKVSYCEKLTHVFTSSMVASLVQLKLLVILACEELEQIIAKDNDDEKDQILSGSDLQSLCFPNLCKVEIYRCNKLRSLFPVAMSIGLPKLQRLEVTNSSQLLGVFGKDDHASPVYVEKQMVFPNLSFLRLYKLPSIVCFSLGCDDFLFPRMEDLMVDECPKLTTKFANKTNVLMSAQLEMTSHDHRSQKDFLQRLEDVKVRRCCYTRTLFPVKWQQALNNLTRLEIVNCDSLEEVFELGEADEGSSEVNDLQLLSSLTRLVLQWLPELKCIWKGPTRHVSLQSLVHLELRFLDKLTFIFTPHLAQSLVHLKTLRIENCSELKLLIREKDDEREIIPDSLGFPKLKSLHIRD
ncbi:disease resistance protein [Salix suchowensis]|nr:disease resistance protein [Salix suchowensis]